MHRLTIINIDDNMITFQDNDNNIYRKAIQFMNTSYLPQVGDIITLSEEILKEENIYTFGKIYNKDKDDIIKIEIKNKAIYLQRYYG